MKLSFQHLFYIMAFIFGLFSILVFAKPILIPLSISLLLSFILFPVVKRFEGWGLNTLVSAFLSLFIMYAIVGSAIGLFSTQIASLAKQVSDFTGKIMNTLTEVLIFINQNIPFIENLNRQEVMEKGKDWLNNSSGSLLQNTFESTAALLTGLLTITIFTFLFLIYRKGLTQSFVRFGDEENKTKILSMLKNIQLVGKQYLSGMFVLILILGFANSTGLWIIGIDNPFLFGFLAAVLSIIPYVGTTLGATIPVLYAFITSDSLWTPFAVAILFWSIQVIESNFLSPKIVGSSLNVNPLVAILSLLIGAAVWGVAGMVLFLPFASMLKVICEEFDQLKPIAMLISSDISGEKKSEQKTSAWIAKVKSWFKNII